MTKATVHMARLTGAEMREAVVRNPVILLPLGSFEDQGPHMPMGDYLLADAVAERIALEATQAGHETYVAPVLPFGGEDFLDTCPVALLFLKPHFRLSCQICLKVCYAMA